MLCDTRHLFLRRTVGAQVILLERDATEKGRLAEETQAAIAKREADVADARRTLREETKIVDEKCDDARYETCY